LPSALADALAASPGVRLARVAGDPCLDMRARGRGWPRTSRLARLWSARRRHCSTLRTQPFRARESRDAGDPLVL